MNTTLLPAELTDFIIVLLLSLLIGLSLRKHFLKQEITHLFGSDRTYSLIGILGYVFYIIAPQTMLAYIFGGAGLLIMLGLYYNYKLHNQQGVGVTSLLIALFCYSIGPLVCTHKLWITIMVVVSVLILNEMKESFIKFTQKINDLEFINLAKFLIIAFVILPILPHNEIIPGIALTPYNIWLSTVVISGFSYISYLLKKYVFNKSGLIVSGLLGGLYSSTATTVILAKKAADASDQRRGEYTTAIFCAISTAYLKYVILLCCFNPTLLIQYWYLFIIMFIISLLTAAFFHFKQMKKGVSIEVEKEDEGKEGTGNETEEDKNPLEFKIALVFALLFIIFTIITHYTLQQFGNSGLRTLSFLVGITDITPFVLNLFQAKYAVESSLLMIATFQAIISNNLVKMIYAIILSKNKITISILAGFGIIIAVNIALLFFIL